MKGAQLTVVYQPHEVENGGEPELIIEQQEWSKNNSDGPSKAEMLKMIKAALYGGEYSPPTDCAVVDGKLTCIIYVYPTVPEMAYQFFTSYGTLSSRATAMLTVTETIEFKLSDRESTEHPAVKIISAQWQWNCFDKDGNQVNRPEISIDGEDIVLSHAVYGTVEVVYQVERHQYTLTVPKREGSIANSFSAVVYGIYDGGISWHEIDLPDGIAEYEDDEALCGWGRGGSGSVIDNDDEDNSPVDSNHSRVTKVNYCAQKVISDTIF